jgi:hypothetical protein
MSLDGNTNIFLFVRQLVVSPLTVRSIVSLRKTFIVQNGSNKLATLRSLFTKGERESGERERERDREQTCPARALHAPNHLTRI